MHYFVVKNQFTKPYRVSLKNFEFATGKKAPYYKKTKSRGKVVEHGYAICPKCGNPIHFVNLFNAGKNKKKKPYARHQLSSIPGLAKFNLVSYMACPYASKKEKEKVLKREEEQRTRKFLTNFKDEFGFEDDEVSLLGTIFEKLQQDCNKNSSYEFFSLLAASCYEGDRWNVVAGIIPEEEAINRLVDLGVDREEVLSLFRKIEDMHGPGGSRGDFGHLSAVCATLLNSDPKKIIGNLAGVYNGVFSIEDNAGYIGDVCGTNGAKPSMNGPDYHADLDAVNIAHRLGKSDSETLVNVFLNYYSGIESGEINRAIEFLENVGEATLNNQLRDYQFYVKGKLYGRVAEAASEEYLQKDIKKYKEYKDQLKTFEAFIRNVKEGRNDWED